ncbi:MAG TPA: 2-C-methyl-D-erythritol 4-phosphate cytidylyltransferase [Candidatus Acidoferrales bacterium]|nr:2-C-methyl-D-erythritol 4-phosphate cytidylyltransferase [Candidatus Acidoferrales bacterium]
MTRAAETPAAWAVIPAAGRGLRMGTASPKQYLDLAGRPVLAWSLLTLLDDVRIRGVVLVVSPEDRRAPLLAESMPAIMLAIGGAERQDSVRAGLAALADQAAPEDWVLVHDAARPCLHRDDLGRLFERAADPDFAGGVLAAPVADTLKRVDAEGRVTGTVSRVGLWRALTPQMFRFQALSQALAAAAQAGITVTDEAQAMERMGHPVAVIPGRADNLKITHPEDLALAQAILAARSVGNLC